VSCLLLLVELEGPFRTLAIDALQKLADSGRMLSQVGGKVGADGAGRQADGRCVLEAAGRAVSVAKGRMDQGQNQCDGGGASP
jgi:hypothetical protein